MRWSGAVERLAPLGKRGPGKRAFRYAPPRGMTTDLPRKILAVIGRIIRRPNHLE
jgi:hypothetical protein